MNEYVIFAYALMAVLLFSALFISVLLTRRAAFKVIKIFCRYDALNARNARNAEELGLEPPGFLERIGKMRDYKPYALRVLKQTEVVRTTTDGRMYMVEDKLTENLRCSRQ